MINLPIVLLSSDEWNPLPVVGLRMNIKISRRYLDHIKNRKEIVLGFYNASDELLSSPEEDKIHQSFPLMLLVNVRTLNPIGKDLVLNINPKSFINVNSTYTEDTGFYFTSDELPPLSLDDPMDQEVNEKINVLYKMLKNCKPIFSRFTPEDVQRIESSERVEVKLSLIASNLLSESEYTLFFFEDTLYKKLTFLNKMILESAKLQIKKEDKSEFNLKETSSKISDFSELNLPKEVKLKYFSEKKRLEEMQPSAGEYPSLSNYISTIESIPWGKYASTKPDLKTIIEVLSENHYGLMDVKETIREHLLIEQLSGNTKGSVLCFTGPPGTGKTSIANAIGRSTGRKIVRIALGGVSDESELRGHRRTYVGARPGRIIEGLRSEKIMDPLFLLDEVDKLSSSSRGDPSSALLEILDSEQNTYFTDRYLELPIDLSRAMFICTANELENVPWALRDRFEVIEFRNYSDEEKLEIAKNFMFPSLKKEMGLTELPIYIEDWSFVRNFKGLRELKNSLRKELRKAAVKIVILEEKEVSLKIETSGKGGVKRLGFA